MSETKKIKRVSTVVFGIISVIFFTYLIRAVTSIAANFSYDPPTIPVFFSWDALDITATLIGVLIFSISFIVSLSLLLSIRKDETLFNRKTVKKLKVIAILFIVFEAHSFIAQRISPIVLFEDAYTRVQVMIPLHGFMLAAGLVVYCVSLILGYGISLQKQVDETL